MLKIYPKWASENAKVNMSAEVKNYLLDSSPGATFTMVTREEIRAIEDTKLAQRQMAYLWGLLKREKANIEDNKVHMEQLKKQVQTGGKLKHVNKCWNSLIVQIEKGKEKTRVIILELKEIKGILKKLPKSNRDELGTCFSSLCAEADSVVNDISDNMKIQCDMNGSRFSVYFQELASMSQSSP